MSGSTVTITPQHQLSLVTGLSDDVARARLEKVVWAAPKDDAGNIVGAPGLHDLRGTARNALVNDLTRFQVRCRIRVASVEALREVCRGAGLPFDEDAPRLVVKGPTDAAIVAGVAPWVDYDLTPEWREYPAIFASWLDYARSEDRRLGAGYVAMKRVEDHAPGGEVVHRWQEYNVRAIDLFDFRLPGDSAPGGTAPLAVPGRDTRTSAEFAQLHAMIAQLQHQIAGMAGAPPAAPPAPAEATTTTTTGASVVIPGERVRDEVPGPGDKFTMPGGAMLDVDEAVQVGYDPDDAYDEGGPEAELALVSNRSGGNQPKVRRTHR